MIISASRRTDIPAFYSDWFFDKIKIGEVCIRNQYNPEKVTKISLNSKNIDGIVFWTKNPLPMMNRLDMLIDYPYYFQFTVNPYDKDLQPNVPKNTIDIFKDLSNKIGKEKVVWRYDPIILTDKYNINFHINSFSKMCKELHFYTNEVIISFIDYYGHTKENLKGINYKNVSEDDINKLMEAFGLIANAYNLKINTCAESVNLDKYGIGHAHCIDKERLENICGYELNVCKDTSQRLMCGCMQSIDIGEYNTCLFGCKYCYANTLIDISKIFHNPKSLFLLGDAMPNDIIINKKINSFRKK